MYIYCFIYHFFYLLFYILFFLYLGLNCLNYSTYLQDKVKSANPFEKTGIMRLHVQLKNFAKQHKITLEKNTVNMRSRERRVVARTFHEAGIVVPYNEKTQLGYRDLAATDSK